MSKRENLERLLIVAKIMKIDVCGIVETWFKGKGEEGEEGEVEDRLRDTEWEWVGKNRKGRKGGGVGFLIRRGMKWRVPKRSKAEGLLWVQVEDEKEGNFLWQ